MGVFATRSPFRPNRIGLSCVKISGVLLDDPEGPVAARIRMAVPADAKPVVFSAPIAAEGVHDLYLITDGEMRLYSWTVR